MATKRMHNTNFDDSSRLPCSERRSRKIAQAMLLVLALLLIIVGLESRNTPLIEGPLWNLQQSSHLKAVILNLGVLALVEFFAYGLIGFLTVVVLAERNRRPSFLKSSLPFALMAGIGLSALVSTAATGPGLSLPNLLDMIFPSIGALLGGWLGTGRMSAKWIAIKLAILAITGLSVALVLFVLTIEPMPLTFAPTDLKSTDRVRLTKLIRSKSPRSIPEGQVVTLSLTERDINQLLAWGLSLGSPNRKAQIELADDGGTLRVSIRLPTGGQSPQFLNVVMTGQADIQNGILDMRISRLDIGSLSIPRPLLRLLSSGLAAKIQSEPLAVPVLAEIQQAEMTADIISATYSRIDMPENFRDDVFGSIGPQGQVHAALSEQFDQIKELGESLPKSSENLPFFLQAAFGLATLRSQHGDPVVENRAALVALGIALGHDLIGEFVAAVPSEKIPRLSPPLTRRIKLQGRVDWSRHFIVSAALEVITTESLSHDIGLLKEELDAGTPGGSGFSFADLAADRSGTMLAKAATSDEASARALQRQLSEEINVDDFFPESRDLPESISQQRLEVDYGGVKGERYLQLLRKIDQRIAECALYHPVN